MMLADELWTMLNLTQLNDILNSYNPDVVLHVSQCMPYIINEEVPYNIDFGKLCY